MELNGFPTTKDCPHCSAPNYVWRVECNHCHQRLQPALLASGPIVLAATNDSVDDLPPGPDAKAYTLKVGRRGDVPDREPNYEYLASRIAAMYEGERTYGIGVDTLASQYPYIYSKARIQAGLRG